MKTFTQEQSQRLDQLILKAIHANVAITSSIPGTAPATVQDLLHTRSIASLDRLADQLDGQLKKTSSSDSRRQRTTKRSLEIKPGFSVEEAIEMLDLIAEKLEAEQAQERAKEKIKSIESELEALETPEERRAKLKEQLSSLKGIPAESDAKA